MQLHRIRLVNFRQHADTEIVLGPGITGVIGPNGAGKTTLLEAIAWAFYGHPAARGSRDFLRWNRAAPRSPVRVEVDFSLGAHEYRVTRGLYQAELFQDRGPQAIASQQEVTSKVTRLLGMSREEFFNTYFTGQKELTVMAQMGPTERGRFLSRVLGYEKLRLAQDLLRERRSALRGERTGLEHGLADRTELERERGEAARRVADTEARVAQATAARAAAATALEAERPQWARIAALRESVLALDGERRLAEQHVDEARREFQRLDRELAEALSAQTKLKELEGALAEVAALREELDRLDREAQAAGRRTVLAGQRREIESQRERVRSRLLEIAGVETALTGADAAVEAAHRVLRAAQGDEERAHTAWVRDRQDAETKRLTLRDQYRDLQAHREGILGAGPDGTCPTCLRPLGAEYQAVLDTLARQLEEIEINGKYFKQRVEQLATEPVDLREAQGRRARAEAGVEEAAQAEAQARERVRELTDLRAELERLGNRLGELEREMAALPERYDIERHERVRARLRALDPAIAQAAQHRLQAGRAGRLVPEAEAAERRLTERETHLTQLGAAIAEAGFSETRYTEARARMDAAEALLRGDEIELARLGGDRQAALEALQNVDRRLRERAERLARVEQLAAEIRLHDELDKAFHDLRTELNAQMRPELSELASAFLSDLTDGRYNELELDEEYRILVMEDGIAKPVLSGGEEDVANLVLRLAISQMVAERAGQPLSLLVLDEVFGSLDEGRRDQVLGLLRRLGDRFAQVVLITHIESVREGVDRVLRVAFDPGRGAAVVTEDQGVPGHEDVAA